MANWKIKQKIILIKNTVAGGIKYWLADFNGDGKQDLVIGNMGLNTQCKASDEEPAEMYYKDFDNNGSVDPILCFYIQHKSYPYVTRDELLDQMSIMRTRFTDYKSYADATIKDIFTEEEMKDAKHLTANHLSTTYFESGADGKFHEKHCRCRRSFHQCLPLLHSIMIKMENQICFCAATSTRRVCVLENPMLIMVCF